MIHNDKYLNQINKCLYNYVYIIIEKNIDNNNNDNNDHNNTEKNN